MTSPNSEKVAFLGLGTMGYPMAGYLASAGHEVCVYNRSTEKAASWVEKHGGTSASTPAQASKDARIVFACVGNDDDVRQVTTGPDGAFSGMSSGAIFVDHTTASADLARELDESAKAGGLGFLDAPVSGGQAGAENGQLTIMVGGDESTFDRVRPVMDVYAKAVTRMGDAGAGQLTKMVNQICIAGLLQGLSEGVNFAQKAGLDTDLVLEVISKGAAQSWQMDNRWGTMAEDKFDFGFAVDWMRKDLGLCLAEADNNGALLPVSALVDQFYSQLQTQGGGRGDTSSLVRLLRQ